MPLDSKIYRIPQEATLECKGIYMNQQLLWKLLYLICDSDGYEYDYTIFDLEEKHD